MNICLLLFRYEGDSDFGVKVSILEAGVRDFKLRGLMRIELKPLVNTLPLVGAVSVSFVKDPVSTVWCVIAGSIFNFIIFCFRLFLKTQNKTLFYVSLK